ncbi:hypothetical protein RND71_022172 [Anisodus tanguticus]|uniref:Uncharacterized protein n=1 Tax=Anisodus tanguticus TaxID=243964 RepID=A0AAE1RZI6_9SOLA|nr:hypothetical protein RND71_022172 [Anisodus tanguticus]
MTSLYRDFFCKTKMTQDVEMKEQAPPTSNSLSSTTPSVLHRIWKHIKKLHQQKK